MEKKRPQRLYLQLATFSLTRTIINTGFRMIYPFLPIFARALGVSMETMALAVTARSSVGFTAPLLGSIADRVGRKTGMLIGMGLFISGLILVIFKATYITLLMGFLLGAAGKIVFDPAMQAYLGDQVQYTQRGRAIAVTEFGWSGAALIGLPIVGWLIARAGWVAPFPLLVTLALMAMAAIWRILPPDGTKTAFKLTFSDALQTIRGHPSALAGLTIALVLSLSNETVNIVYGVWMEEAFGLRVSALGAASAVIGLAELTGEGLVASLTDRIGKRLAIGIGIALLMLASLSLPLLGNTISGALVGLFLIFITFEFAFVSAISWMTELLPGARATLMAGNLAAAAGGRALGALIGPPLFKIGLYANSAVAAFLAGSLLVILVLCIRVE